MSGCSTSPIVNGAPEGMVGLPFFQSVESDGESTNNTAVYVSKVILTTPVTNPSGLYLIHWGCELGQAVVALLAVVRLLRDGAVVDNESTEDVVGELAAHSNHVVRTLTAGSHTLDLQFRCSAVTVGVGARIRRARIWAARVGP